MAGPTSVEEYMAGLSEDSRAVLEELRTTIRSAVPEASETISYQMPTFKLHGRFLVSYAAFKSHYSLFPASGAVVQALGNELTPYYSGKGTLRFPASKPLPLELVTKVVKVRVQEENTRAGL